MSEKYGREWKIRLEIPNLSRHDYKEKISLIWNQQFWDFGKNQIMEGTKRKRP